MNLGNIRGCGVLSIGGELFAVRAQTLRAARDEVPTVELALLQSYDYSAQAEIYKAKAVEYINEIKSRQPFEIKEVIFNDPATIVVWSDGTKTVVKCQPNDVYSRETGLAMCIAKKFLGNKGNFNEVFKKYIEDYDSPLDNGIPKVGTHIKILDAGCGAYGANGKIGRVTTKGHISGLLWSDPGYNVEVESGEVWRISKSAEIEILNRGK